MNKLLIIGFMFCLASLSVVQAEVIDQDNDQIIDQTPIKRDMALIDPTRPAIFREEILDTQLVSGQQATMAVDDSTGELRLHAIRISDTSRLAVINGETLRTGERLGKAKLIKINTGSVDMDVNGEVFTISLLPDSIKKRSSKR